MREALHKELTEERKRLIKEKKRIEGGDTQDHTMPPICHPYAVTHVCVWCR